MNILRHILAKDVRRLRWPLLAWLVVVIIRVVVVAARSDFAFEDFALQIAVENVSGLLIFIDLPLLVLLVSWLVHDEPLIGPDAFWVTRPIPPMTLMAAKLTFAIIFLIGAPVLVQSMAVAGLVHPTGHAIRLIPGLLFSQSLWVAALIAVATITASLTRFLLVMVVGAAAVALALSAMLTIIVMTAEERSYPSAVVSDQTAAIVRSWLLLTVALVVIALQYQEPPVQAGMFRRRCRPDRQPFAGRGLAVAVCQAARARSGRVGGRSRSSRRHSRCRRALRHR